MPKKSKTKLHEYVRVIRLDMYPINVWVVATNNIQESANQAGLHVCNDNSFVPCLTNTDACVVRHEECGDIYLITPFKFKPQNIVHEITHIVFQVSRFLNIHNEEFDAYLSGWLFEEIIKILKKAK